MPLFFDAPPMDLTGAIFIFYAICTKIQPKVVQNNNKLFFTKPLDNPAALCYN